MYTGIHLWCNFKFDADSFEPWQYILLQVLYVIMLFFDIYLKPFKTWKKIVNDANEWIHWIIPRVISRWFWAYGNLQMLCNPIGSFRIYTYIYTYPFSSCFSCSVNIIYYLTHRLLGSWHFEFEERKKIHHPTKKLFFSHEYFNSKSLYRYFIFQL